VTAALPSRGRVVLVTGGTRGIGSAIAARFLDDGAEVIVCGRQAPAALPGGAAGPASFISCDVRDPLAVAALVEAVVARHGRLDVAVNNAGGSPPADAATASAAFSRKVVELNLLAPLVVSQAANAVMQQQPEGGVIVMVGSVSGLRPSPGTAAYGAAKAGLHHLAASLAVEWAPRVRVNTVAAGLVRTELARLHYGGDAEVAAIGATVPLGRMAEPSDVAEACLWLASMHSAYVSGATLVLHGGGERPAFLAAAAPAAAAAPGHAPKRP